MAKRNKKQRKQKKRQERLREQKHLRRSLPKELRDEDVDEYEDYMNDEEDFGFDEFSDMEDNLPEEQMFFMEKKMREIQKAIEDNDIKDSDELNEYLESLNISGSLELEPENLNDGDKAQELAYQAMATHNCKKSCRLAKQALKLDPACLDALVIMAVNDSKSLDECIGKLKKAVEIGEHSLGENFFEENMGDFWGILETRPYMRTRDILAEHLILAGRYEEAKTHYEAMMELNPGDNQGLRYTLLSCYLVLKDLEGAEKLLDQSDEYMDAILLWGKVLFDYLKGDIKTAEITLQKAREMNPHAEIFFSGKKPLPADPPASYSPGKESEAVMCAFNLGTAWSKHPEAMDWLRSGDSNAGGLRLIK